MHKNWPFSGYLCAKPPLHTSFRLQANHCGRAKKVKGSWRDAETSTTIVVIVFAGTRGHEVFRQLRTAGVTVRRLRRSGEHAARLRGEGADAAVWDTGASEKLRRDAVGARLTR